MKYEMLLYIFHRYYSRKNENHAVQLIKKSDLHKKYINSC